MAATSISLAVAARRMAVVALYFCLLPRAFAFGFDDVAAQAQKLAAAPYAEPKKNLPPSLADLDYDQLRDIRFIPQKQLWHGKHLPFQVAFFHQGRSFDSPIHINEIVGKKVHAIRFDPSQFDYGANTIPPDDLKGLGFAGFRVYYPVNTSAYKDEVLSFLGASYFRALGKGQLYGLSARGLAIDTALPSGEEFPYFREFWIQRPARSDQELTIYALLDSRRVSGAYRFVVRPGVDTVVDVRARLYLRESVTKLGIAPLTSMYFFGENQRSTVADYRPEVHDSDGLSIHSGTGEWLWRPLVNPKHLLVTSFALTNPIGFGLMQRDRSFKNYEDLESHYEKRPSVWIEPEGQWGPGRVELVQIPTPDETNDNIVAYWVPGVAPRPGVPFDIEYRMLWQKEAERRPPSSWVAQTRRGHGWVHKQDDSISFAVDFEGPALKKLAAGDKVKPVVTVDANGKILETNVIRNDTNGGWRMTVKFKRLDDKKPVELRGYLSSENTTLSETWSYILPPD